MTRRDSIIVSMRRLGLTLDEIGARHGISKERVRQVLARAGVASKKCGRWSPEQSAARLAAGAAAYVAGDDLAAAASSACVTRDRLSAHLRAGGLMRSRFTAARHGVTAYGYGCRCETCTRANTDRCAAANRGRRERGLCWRCSASARPGASMCEKHLAALRARGGERRI